MIWVINMGFLLGRNHKMGKRNHLIQNTKINTLSVVKGKSTIEVFEQLERSFEKVIRSESSKESTTPTFYPNDFAKYLRENIEF